MLPITPITPPDAARARALLQQARATAGIGEGTDSVDVTAVNRDFGKALSGFAQAGADAAEEAGDLLDLPGAAERIQQKAARVKDLEVFKNDAEQLVLSATRDWHAGRIDLAGEVTQVFQAAEAVALHPSVSVETKERVARATAALFALREARWGETRNAQQATRAANVHESDKATTSARIATLESELVSTRLENRVLSGTAGRIAEITAPVPAHFAPVAPMKRRRPGRGK